MCRFHIEIITIVTLAACTHPHPPAAPPAVPPPPPPAASANPALVDPELVLLVTPSPEGHQPFIRAIDAAHAAVDMTMFHLSDPEVVVALERAAGRGVDVRVILDHEGAAKPAAKKMIDQLEAAGVKVQPSSPAFSLTHAKAMVVDGQTAFITAINLTKDADRTRDLGIVTRVPAVVADVAQLFAADWSNAETHGHTTPALSSPSLVVSPVSSRDKLIALIASAHDELLVTVENLGDPRIDQALSAAISHHVRVRVIVPLCDKNPNPLYNLPAARELAHDGADVRVMPAPETPDTPYMHSKMILADHTTAYVGSVNFSVNSTTKARELGVIFANPAAAATIASLFDTDYAHAIAPPADDAGVTCH